MTVELYPECIYEADLSPDVATPEVEAVCTEIDEASHGWGADEARLINDVGSLTPEMRCKVPLRFEVCAYAALQHACAVRVRLILLCVAVVRKRATLAMTCCAMDLRFVPMYLY